MNQQTAPRREFALDRRDGMSTNGKKRPAVKMLLAVFTMAALAPAILVAEEKGVTVDKTRLENAAATYPQPGASETQIKALQERITQQQTQIDQLLGIVGQLKQRLDGATPSSNPSPALLPSVGTVASVTPVIPATARSPEATPVVALSGSPASAAASQEQIETYTRKVDALGKSLDSVSKNLGGFKLSGDLRFRWDGAFRSGNSVAGPLQNARERYRIRVNLDKPLSDQFGFHLQVGTGTANNPLTFDTDFAGADTRGPFFILESYADYHPNKNINIRAGRMEEVFADNSRFFFDDDIRFNGAHEIAKVSLGKSGSLEFRAGQYIFTNPNVQILPSAAACAGANPPATCIFEQAGFAPGTNVRDSNLFHEGLVLSGKSGDNWGHRVTVDFQSYRNPNEFLIALAASGTPVLVNGYSGITVSGGAGQGGNGTTTKGGFIYTAPDFHVGHLQYRIDYKGWNNWPLFLDLQGSHNYGSSFLSNAEMATVGIGQVKKFGDARLMYGYFIKDANSMISEVTDDDIGTGVGTNIRAHMIRFDLGLAKFLQWQNILFIQDELSPNDPARNFFVPLQRGANTSYRIHSQFVFSF